ncbi:uncharacterized protein LOC129263337 isoform X2 [Lytechinus pictus]|uniref:uncharacterized protein LOC129263337 isoform X2 n=1 Tax=Lytechinus pictus TaxID=7653 RepID=UPI00240E8CC8|nr:uncharacterized protein LOC129263337 isoform X2 [Lytechinus pictus]
MMKMTRCTTLSFVFNLHEVPMELSEDEQDPVWQDQTAPNPRKRARCMYDFDVENIILKGRNGRGLLEALTRGRVLKNSERIQLNQVLVSHLIEEHGWNPPSPVKESLAQSLVDQFKILKDNSGITGYEQWFIAGRKHHPASGSLEDRLRYVRMRHYQQIRKENPVRDEQGKRSKEGKRKAVGIDELPTLPEDKIMEAIEWMKYNDTPKVKVQEMMAETCKPRYSWIRSDRAPTTAEILARYPRLLDPGIVQEDFRLTISDQTNQLYAKWPAMSKQVFQYSSEIQKDWKEKLGEVEVTELSDDEYQTLAFSLLPVLFVGRGKGMKGRCSAKEAVTSFIDFKPEGTSIDYYLANLDGKERPQPFLLILGGSRWKPNQVFVIIERSTIQCSSIIQGVDVCFKLTYVLDVDYQAQCSPAWQMLQHLIYELPPGALSGVALLSFRTWLSNIQKED